METSGTTPDGRTWQLHARPESLREGDIGLMSLGHFPLSAVLSCRITGRPKVIVEKKFQDWLKAKKE